EKEDEYHKLANPLVLLIGAAKYENVKIDLLMFRNVFEKIYGYDVYCTYDPNKPETESLTVSEFDLFLTKHCNTIERDSNGNDYDSLIFVWCGYGSIVHGDVLITSDDNHKSFKTIQKLLSQNETFLNKPKIFIKNAWMCDELPESIKRGNIQTQKWYQKNPKTLIVSTTQSRRIHDAMASEQGSYFTQSFCNVMEQNISLCKSFKDNLRVVSKLISEYVSNGQTIHYLTTLDRQIFFYKKSKLQQHTMNENEEWNEANKIAHEVVNRLIHERRRGIVVVSTNIDQLAEHNDKKFWQNVPFTMMINSNRHMKTRLISGRYSICAFHSKNIIFDNVTIDGCVYAVDCIIDGIVNCHITQQLIHTDRSLIRCHFNAPVFTCSWPIDAKHLMKLGIESFNKSNFNEAIQLFRFVICVMLQTSGDVYTELYDSHADIATSYGWLGIIYNSKGDYNEATDCYKKSLKIRLSKLGPDHISVATLYNNLGNAYKNKGEYNKAIEYHKKSLEIRWQKLGPDHPDVATSYSNLGSAYESKGSHQNAIEYHTKSLEIRLKKLEPDHPDIATSYNNLGNIFENKEDYDKAIGYYRKDLIIGLNKRGSDHPDVAVSYNNLGSIYKNKGEYDKAIEYYKKALKIQLNKLGPDHIHVANSYNNLGLVYKSKGEYNKAIEYYEKDLKISLNKLSPNHPDVVATYNNLASVYYNKQEYDKAMKFAKKALKKMDFNHPYIGISYDILGAIHYKKGDKKEAKRCYENALSIYTQKWDSDKRVQNIKSRLKKL
ncbi:hypothetical protein RFI_02048, partial [Reticulomyxa filosa]